MADMENKNQTNWNGTPGVNNGTEGTPGNRNPHVYQDGYYRNTNPHQDEAIGSQTGQTQSGAQQTTPPTGTRSTAGSANEYTYVNYYSNPNGTTPGDSGQKPKKKHTGLKVVAFVCAMVIVSGASIGVYDAVRTVSNSDSGSSSVVTEADKNTAEENDTAANSNSSKKEESWIELAAGSNAMSVSDIVDKVTPSVVGVQATFTVTSGDTGNIYGGFFGFGNQNTGNQEVTGVGTGIIMSEDGYIITNAHVIYDDEYGYGEASAIQVQMSDQETTYAARIVAYDQEADIAVLKVDAEGLTPAEFGDSSSCRVGEMVVAIGNPLGLEFQNTVTCGIISALNRKVTINDNAMTLIQTDTAINNGNSGGPLINSAGQVIGINSAKMSSTYSGEATIEGIGFAIPMSEAQVIIDDLINYGYVTGRPQLGITCQDVTEAVSQAYHIPVGAYVVSVTEGGSADAAGLQPGDVITAIQDQKISTTEELNNIKNEYKAGDTITLTVVRSGSEMTVDVTLEEVQATAKQ